MSLLTATVWNVLRFWVHVNNKSVMRADLCVCIHRGLREGELTWYAHGGFRFLCWIESSLKFKNIMIHGFSDTGMYVAHLSDTDYKTICSILPFPQNVLLPRAPPAPPPNLDASISWKKWMVLKIRIIFLLFLIQVIFVHSFFLLAYWWVFWSWLG